MLENTNIKQVYPGPIVNKIIDITEFLFKNPEQIHITYTYKDAENNLVDRELTYGTEYEVTKILPSDIAQADAALTASTGRVTLKGDIDVALGERLTVYRISELVQETQYPRTGPFPAASHEGALDYLTMQNQEQQDQIDRALKVPISSANFEGSLPNPKPNRALKINDNGSGFTLSDYDPDLALITTKEYMETAQTAAINAQASQNAAAASASSIANSVTEVNNAVNSGLANITKTVTEGSELLDEQITNGSDTITASVDSFKTYMNNNPYSGKSIGEFFWTFRTDTINGAYECNGQEFEASLFSGANNPYDLLVAGKLPVKTYSEWLTELETNGSCGYFGLDTVNQKFKLPKINAVYIQATVGTNTGEFIKETLPNITGELKINAPTETPTGCFSKTTRTISRLGGTQGSTGNTIALDASKSSSTYVTNGKVQPSSIKLRPMVQLVTSATEVSFADYATQFSAALNNAINDLSATGQAYLEQLTPTIYLYARGERELTLKANTFIRLKKRQNVGSANFDTLWFVNLNEITFNPEELLDEGTTFQPGKQYNLFLVPNANYTAAELKVSLNYTSPIGYSYDTSRRIGGWHTLCADTTSINGSHPFAGGHAGDIIPMSVWTLYHRPCASPNNMIYIPSAKPFWRSIYDHSGTGETTAFEYGATITTSQTFYSHLADLNSIGCQLPTYEQAVISAYNTYSENVILGATISATATAGGHVDTSNNRIISQYGAEDTLGCLWKYTAGLSGAGGNAWISAGNTTDGQTAQQYGTLYAILQGGDFSSSGKLSSYVCDGAMKTQTASASVASFGVSDPLPRRAPVYSLPSTDKEESLYFTDGYKYDIY